MILDQFEKDYKIRCSKNNDEHDPARERNNDSLRNEPDEKSNNELDLAQAQDQNQIDSSTKPSLQNTLSAAPNK